MKIGIIGAGNIGGTLVRRFRALGHDVSVANSRGPETLAELARETGAKAVTVEQAARGQDVVVVTIPEKHIPELPRDLFAGAPASLVVVDTGNYYPQRDGRLDEIESGMPESVWVSRTIGRSVVKAFNNIYAKHLMENGKTRGADCPAHASSEASRPVRRVRVGSPPPARAPFPVLMVESEHVPRYPSSC